MSSVFNEWINTEEGRKCADDSGTPIKNPYLTNRLQWAFLGGLEHNPQFLRMKSAIEKAFVEVKKLKKLNKEKDKEIAKLKKELADREVIWIGI